MFDVVIVVSGLYVVFFWCYVVVNGVVVFELLIFEFVKELFVEFELVGKFVVGVYGEFGFEMFYLVVGSKCVDIVDFDVFGRIVIGC